MIPYSCTQASLEAHPKEGKHKICQLQSIPNKLNHEQQIIIQIESLKPSTIKLGERDSGDRESLSLSFYFIQHLNSATSSIIHTIKLFM